MGTQPINNQPLKFNKMEENQPKTGKFALTYGLLLGGISVIFAFYALHNGHALSRRNSSYAH